jgi:hypothetical protein
MAFVAFGYLQELHCYMSYIGYMGYMRKESNSHSKGFVDFAGLGWSWVEFGPGELQFRVANRGLPAGTLHNCGLDGFVSNRLADDPFPLTPALSLGERESRRSDTRLGMSVHGGVHDAHSCACHPILRCSFYVIHSIYRRGG